jgi:ABC-type sugar transport system ATPase subunit
MEEPTKGIDVNAKTEVYRLIMQLVKDGKAVMLVSSENPELLGICDRILVMREGKIVKELIPSETTEQEITYFSIHEEV